MKSLKQGKKDVLRFSDALNTCFLFKDWFLLQYQSQGIPQRPPPWGFISSKETDLCSLVISCSSRRIPVPTLTLVNPSYVVKMYDPCMGPRWGCTLNSPPLNFSNQMYKSTHYDTWNCGKTKALQYSAMLKIRQCRNFSMKVIDIIGEVVLEA